MSSIASTSFDVPNVLPDRFLRLNDVEFLVSLKKTAIYGLIKHGEFPSPTRIGGASRWSLRQITEWIDDRLGRTLH